MESLRRMIVAGGCLICMVCFCAALMFAADTEKCYADSDGPVVTSISITNASNPNEPRLDAQGKAKVRIEFIDNSAVSYVSLIFKNDNDHYRELSWQNDEGNTYYRDVFERSFPLNNAFADGEYRLVQLSIGDAGGNTAEYFEEQLAGIGPTTSIDIYNSTADLTPPVLKGFKVLNTGDIDAQGKISFELDVVEAGSGVRHLAIEFANPDGHTVQLGWDFGTPFKTVKKTLSKKAFEFGNGPYNVSFIQLYDANDNQSYYTPADQPEVFTDTGINVVNSNADTRAPVITAFTLNTHEITTPDLVGFDLTFTDETCAMDVCLTFEDGDGHRIEMGMVDGEGFRLNPGSYTNLQLPFGAFLRPGEYLLTGVSIQDAFLTRNYGGEELIPDEAGRRLVVRSQFDFAEDGSLLNIPAALATIDGMGEGKTIVLDSRDEPIAPKELFTAIAGLDKTIVFDDGDIQWVFNGKTVKPERCKEINVRTLIRTYSGISMGFPDDPTIVAVIFKNNGTLPGPADIRINNNYIKTKFAKQTRRLFFSHVGSGLPTVVDDSAGIAKDNAAETTIGHNSTYVLSTKKPRKAALTGAKIAKTSYTYSGKALKPAVPKVTAEKKAAAAKGYKIIYKNNKNVGTASVIIQGTGIYKGKLTRTFKINPKGTPLKKLKKKKPKSIIVRWKRQSSKMSKSRITGYQILLATNKSFTKNKRSVYVKGYKKVTKTVTKLKGGKKYYVKIRTYKTVKGKKYFSPWSKVRTIRTKKK